MEKLRIAEESFAGPRLGDRSPVRDLPSASAELAQGFVLQSSGWRWFDRPDIRPCDSCAEHAPTTEAVEAGRIEIVSPKGCAWSSVPARTSRRWFELLVDWSADDSDPLWRAGRTPAWDVPLAAIHVQGAKNLARRRDRWNSESLLRNGWAFG